MSSGLELPFILKYEEQPGEGSMIDGLVMEYFRDPLLNGMQLRNKFIAWDSPCSLKEIWGPE